MYPLTSKRTHIETDTWTMNIQPNIPDADGFYEALMIAHEGLSDTRSAELNARLVFILANQIGDQDMLLECVALARKSGG